MQHNQNTRCFFHTTIFRRSRNCSIDVMASARLDNRRLVFRFPLDVHTGNGSHITDCKG